jgi:hypothetical protein
MSEPFDVVVVDGGAAAGAPRDAVDRGSDPFSAWSEARVHELVTGHRRHGLDTVTLPEAQPTRNRAGRWTTGNLAGYLRSTYVDPRRAAS